MSTSVSPSRWRWITISGPDAAAYLQRMTTVNIRELAPGDGSNGCLLNAQGRIQGFFTLWRIQDQEFAFELDAGADAHWVESLLAAIDQFHFTEDFSVKETHPELQSTWFFPKDGQPSGTETPGVMNYSLDSSTGCYVCDHGSRDFGRPWTSVWGTADQLARWHEQNPAAGAGPSADEVESWRIQSLRPKADLELTADSNPLELGLIDSISSNKGCYPGQEVIERIASLGSPPRRLARIEGTGPLPEAGSVLLNHATPPNEVGKLTSVIASPSGFQALAILRKIHAKEGLEVSTATGATGKVVEITPYA